MTFAAFFGEPTKSWLVCFPSKKSFRLKDPQRKVEHSRYISVKDPQELYLRPEKFSFEMSPVYLSANACFRHLSLDCLTQCCDRRTIAVWQRSPEYYC